MMMVMSKETVATNIVNGNSRHDKENRPRSHGKRNEIADKE
jgi:hypothetical protein